MSYLRAWCLHLLWLLTVATPAFADVGSTEGKPPSILVFGDSISAGYGIDLTDSWPSLLDGRLREHPTPWTVVNASSSGETTVGGRVRIEGLLAAHKPSIVVLELGGNDGLRGLAPKVIYGNLRTIAESVASAGATCIIAGMHIPPNYGPRYTEAFHALFAELAEELDVPLVPFLLEGIATNPDLMQADGIHPTAEAQPLIVDNLWPVLEPLLEEASVSENLD